MVKLKILKNYKDFKRGDVVEVTGNIAFSLVDKGVATKEITKSKNKMMTKRRLVKTKKWT